MVLGETAASQESSTDGGDAAEAAAEEEAAPAEPAPERQGGSLASTGLAAARLALVAAILGLAGWSLLYAGRRRARRVTAGRWIKA